MQERMGVLLAIEREYFRHLFVMYGMMVPSRKQREMKIGKMGSKRLVETRLVGSGAVDFCTPRMIGSFTAIAPKIATRRLKILHIRLAITG